MSSLFGMPLNLNRAPAFQMVGNRDLFSEKTSGSHRERSEAISSKANSSIVEIASVVLLLRNDLIKYQINISCKIRNRLGDFNPISTKFEVNHPIF
ncbi:hypothetical protein E0K83_15925 [Gramella sp. BOM4]|nr:hypothetical protein [Christiangramia bathymodioli]